MRHRTGVLFATCAVLLATVSTVAAGWMFGPASTRAVATRAPDDRAAAVGLALRLRARRPESVGRAIGMDRSGRVVIDAPKGPDYRWDGERLIPLSLPAGTLPGSSWLNAVSPGGVIAGAVQVASREASNEASRRHAAIWVDGVPRVLPSVASTTDCVALVANDAGEVLGFCWSVTDNVTWVVQWLDGRIGSVRATGVRPA